MREPLRRLEFSLSPEAALALGVFLIALWAQGATLVGVFFDDGIYVTLGKALAQGQGYRNIHLPGAPPGIHYPPLYPLLLSAVWRIWPSFPANAAAMALLDAASLAAAAAVVAHHARRLPLPAAQRFTVLALGFAAFPLLTVVRMRLSEPLFLLLAAGAVSAADRDDPSSKHGLLAGLLAGLCYLAKSVGLSVVAGIPLALWLRHQRRAAVAAGAASLVLIAPWMLWVALHHGDVDPRLANYTTYFAEVKDAGPGAVLGGLKLRALEPLAALMVPRTPPWAWYPLAAATVVALLAGALRAARQAPALVAALAIYLAVVSLWPFPPHRFVWIVLPWLLLLIALGLAAAWHWGRRGRWAAALAGAVLLAGYGPREALSLARRGFASAADGISLPFRSLIPAIAQETPPSAVVASEDEALIYLYTGRRTVPSHLFRWAGLGTERLPDSVIVAFWCQAGVTHLAVSGPGDAALPLAASAAGRKDSLLVPLFQVTQGPGLYRFRCPR